MVPPTLTEMILFDIVELAKARCVKLANEKEKEKER